MIVQSRLREVLHYNSKTGLWIWKISTARCRKIGEYAGSRMKDGYEIISIDGKRYMAHRLAFLYMKGAFPKQQVDHIDGDKSNNSWSNLRHASPRENKRNQPKLSSNKSGYKGVCSIRNKWRSQIRIDDGKLLHLGNFDTPEDASVAYEQA